ncbi:MAG: DNA polymerase III subunit delta' C-terminal domain-containing protein [Eubacteriales bacterium]
MQGAKQAMSDAKKGAIKSAYLVTCPKPRALSAYAQTFLLNLYCKTHNACGNCSGCKKIMSGSAADVFSIMPQKGIIKIGQIREINDFLYEKPFEAAHKAVIIYEADKMNTAAQNALLKPLEEPPKNTVFMLLAGSDYGLLPTVISRCENIRLLPMGQGHASELLVKEGVRADRATLALALAQGYYEEAAVLASDDDFFALREQTFQLFYKMMAQNTYAVSTFVSFLEDNKAKLGEVLDILKLALMDILKIQYLGRDARLVNIDQKDTFFRLADSFTTGAIYNMMEKLLEHEGRMKYNVNFILSCESMLFEILKEKYQWLKS